MRTNTRTCIFIHYSTSFALSYHIQVYIKELSRHFDEIEVLTNNTSITDQICSLSAKIRCTIKKNQGYDFGMFYRFIKDKDLSVYKELAVVNDSNILLNKLDTMIQWGRNTSCDYWGAIDSQEKPWFSSHAENYHIQSHFLVLNKRAIQKLPSFFRTCDIEGILQEQDMKTLRRLVIDQWEIGFSQYLKKKGLKGKSFIESAELNNRLSRKPVNAANKRYHTIAGLGYPFLKKKVILKKSKPFRTKSFLWKWTIKKYGSSKWDMNLKINEVKQIRVRKAS